MFVHEDLITIIFRLTSFGLFVFLCVCLFKRYLRPSIVGMMKQEQDELQKIKDRHKELGKQERSLDITAQEQEDRIRLLKERIAHWQRVEQISVQKRAQERQTWWMAHNKRVVRQAQLCAHATMLRTMVPEVMDKVERNVSAQYAQATAQHQYVAALLERQLRGES